MNRVWDLRSRSGVPEYDSDILSLVQKFKLLTSDGIAKSSSRHIP
jgi:hypothetical protein